MDANGTGSTRILQHAEEAKSPRRILVRSLLKSRNKLRAKYRELRAECKRWRNQAAAVERSRSTWRKRTLAGEAAAQEERAERIAVAAELQQVRGQSKEREAELAALRAQLVTSERAEKRGAEPAGSPHRRASAGDVGKLGHLTSRKFDGRRSRARDRHDASCRTPVPVAGPACDGSRERKSSSTSRDGVNSIDTSVSGGQPLAGLVRCSGGAARDGSQAVVASTPRVLETVFGFLLGRTTETAVMAWTTVRCWLMRLGLYALLRPLKQADDWAYLIDHTVQIGKVKCFAVVGVQLSQLPYPHRCLQREDLELIALVPMVHSTAVTVEQALEEAALRTGVPRLIVSDQGGDVRGGIERYCRSHRHAIATCDTAHKGANLLRRLLEADERWAKFVAQLSQTKAKLQQTSLACCVGPRLRPKARFMNLAAPLRWARWCLRVLDQPWPKDESLSDRQRAVLATIDRKQLEAKLGWLRDYRQAIDEWSQWHEVIQVVVRQARRHGIDRDSVAELQRQFTAMKLSPSGQETAAAMMEFIAEQAWVARVGGELLIVSTEILESLFGAYKNLEGQQSESGVTGLMLVVGALVSSWKQEAIKEGLEATPWKAVEAWIEKRLGPTVQSQRRTLQTIFAEP